MSWQEYVDTQLINPEPKVADAAGIYDLQGNPWAYSAGFAVSSAHTTTVGLPKCTSHTRARTHTHARTHARAPPSLPGPCSRGEQPSRDGQPW